MNPSEQEILASLKRWVITGALALFVFIPSCSIIKPWYNVYAQTMEGKAIYARSQSERLALVSQAQAEKDSAELRAQAIQIVGEAAQKYPEYRKQEFIGAFARAMEEGKINQIIYVPTEANIPITEAGHK